MNKFLFKCLLILPVFIIIGSVNYFVDPGNVFHAGKAEKEIGTYLANGYNVTNAYNFDDRLMRYYLLKQLKYDPEIVVLSSSRGGFISSNIFPGKKIVNSFLRGAGIEDYLALYDLLQGRDAAVSKVILILDPWLLNDNTGENRWITLRDNYLSMLKKIGVEADDKNSGSTKVTNSEVDKLQQLFSFTYFDNAVKLVTDRTPSYRATKQKNNAGLTYFADGSMAYDKKRRNANIETVRQTAYRYISDGPIFQLADFKTLSESKKKMLEKLVSHFENIGIEVEFYLPPYHPIVYDFLASKSEYREVLLAERYFIELARRNNIVCKGSYDPKVSGLSEKDFYDGMHSKENAVEHIFKDTNLQGRVAYNQKSRSN